MAPFDWHLTDVFNMTAAYEESGSTTSNNAKGIPPADKRGDSFRAVVYDLRPEPITVDLLV
ncbi:hypothetical protein T265_09942 [Opisthorchis viverrini]|uniref:Uncharacterized protein n=1 Tax=Opisthorchis viverrini TaxID=6198 RepID=A0A074Z413_OPIVI|nr:hypothetical protein T265_09942 [Opisthorchis viverrini]KER21826.1 hypothetical protein T265_09942 [Opisthorchis viverrini]